MSSFDFAQPWALLLLPLALAPLLRRRRDRLSYSHLAWLPPDPLGRIAGLLWQGCGVLAILATVLALAGPGKPETQVARSGRGAEILILMDRSRSMDDKMLPSDWRTVDPIVLRHQVQSRGEKKAIVARDVLSSFVAQRPDDRFSLSFFSTRPLQVVPFTQHDEIMQAAITAGGIGRGLSDTDVGRAVAGAIQAFDQRAYTGSRIILLVSDGGAQLDEGARQLIAKGLARNRIALYWIYLRAFNGPVLDNPDPLNEAIPEVAMHRFFQTLATPYRLYQAEAPQDMAQAVADVGRQQNLPFDFFEQVPRRDLSSYFLALAALCCMLLLGYRAMVLRSWS